MTNSTIPIFHWIKRNELEKGIKGKTMCGVQITSGLHFCTEPTLPFVNCKICKEIWQKQQKTRIQKLCSFCSTPLSDEDYENSNEFYLSCFQHKQLAQIETEKFFKKNPDYRKWQV